jgi:hypothetical protein
MTVLAADESEARDPLTGADLENVEWRYRSEPCRALDFGFVVRSTDERLGRYLARLIAPFGTAAVTGDAQTHEYSIVAGGQGAAPVDLYEDGELIERSTAAMVVEHLIWRLNRHVVETSKRYLLLHAAAAQRGAVGAVFPAPSGSGKTTLVAGLVRAGLHYLTDEAAAIDPETGLLEPYPKPLSVETGSWTALSDIVPDRPAELGLAMATQWHVEPASIRADAIGSRCRPRLVVSPTYVEDATTELTPISRAEGVALLAQNSFNFAQHGRRGLLVLADIVRDAECYRLRFGDLDDACRAILELVEVVDAGQSS